MKEYRVIHAFENKTGQEVKTIDSWQIFKIMAEFIEGFEKLAKIGPCVSVMGSARTPKENKYYLLTEQIAGLLAKLGYGVISGGGPGIMEAANKGAAEAKGKSVGINIELAGHNYNNEFIDADKMLEFKYFFVRKVMLTKYAQGFIIMPGGFGTLDEFFEAVTLIQTGKIARFPVVLVGTEYWAGLINWTKDKMLSEKNIKEDDLDLFRLADTAEDAVDYIDKFYKKYALKPNF